MAEVTENLGHKELEDCEHPETRRNTGLGYAGNISPLCKFSPRYNFFKECVESYLNYIEKTRHISYSQPDNQSEIKWLYGKPVKVIV